MLKRESSKISSSGLNTKMMVDHAHHQRENFALMLIAFMLLMILWVVLDTRRPEVTEPRVSENITVSQPKADQRIDQIKRETEISMQLQSDKSVPVDASLRGVASSQVTDDPLVDGLSLSLQKHYMDKKRSYSTENRDYADVYSREVLAHDQNQARELEGSKRAWKEDIKRQAREQGYQAIFDKDDNVILKRLPANNSSGAY